ncbi:hypothetical protein POVCU2_0037570, partial [Plasmodium ovale curtisi]
LFKILKIQNKLKGKRTRREKAQSATNGKKGQVEREQSRGNNRMRSSKCNQAKSNPIGRNKYELRCKKNEVNKIVNEEESEEEASNELSDSSLSCSSKYMAREDRQAETALRTNANGVGNTNGVRRTISNGIVKGVVNGMANGVVNEMANGMANGMVNRMANGMANGMVNGMANGRDVEMKNFFSKHNFVYENYRKKDVLLSLWWKNIIDLYSDILITNVCSNVSNVEILNMGSSFREDYQYLREGVILFHNSKKRNNYKMSILRVITKEEVNKKNENHFFYPSALKNNVIDDSFKKYYGKKYKHIPLIRRYNCMDIPYYVTNSAILYCGAREENGQSGEDLSRGSCVGDGFMHDGNVLIANKSINGRIYLYSLKKTIERINRMEQEEMAEEEKLEKEIVQDDAKPGDDCGMGSGMGNGIGSGISSERETRGRRGRAPENYRKKLQQRKVCDGEVLLELSGHSKTGKGLCFKNNYLLSNGDDKNIFIYDINSSSINGHNGGRASINTCGELNSEDKHAKVGKINPYISIKTNELYSNVKWLYDSIIIGSTYSGYFSIFDIRMKNKIIGHNYSSNVNTVVDKNFSRYCAPHSRRSGSGSGSGNGSGSGSGNGSGSLNGNSVVYGPNCAKCVNIHSIHKKITKYEISDIDKYNNYDNNLICLSSLNNIFIFDIRFINNNLPYKIIHDNSYNNYCINDSYFEPYQTNLQNGEYNYNTNVNYFYDHSYNNYYNEDFFNSDTFIHSLFWCNIEGFNYIGSLNNKGIINLYDVNKNRQHCVFTYGCKYIKIFKFNPFKVNNFLSVDKNNILILFTLPDQIYKSDLDIYLRDNFGDE